MATADIPGIALPDPWQMSNLTARFYACLDSRDYAGVIACFAEDGIWHRRGGHVQGHAAIAQALDARPANFHTAHIVTNLQVEQHSADEGSVTFTMTGHSYTGDIASGHHVAQPPAHIVAQYRDSMRKVDGCWVITEKKNLRTFYKDSQHLA